MGCSEPKASLKVRIASKRHIRGDVAKGEGQAQEDTLPICHDSPLSTAGLCEADMSGSHSTLKKVDSPI